MLDSAVGVQVKLFFISPCELCIFSFFWRCPATLCSLLLFDIKQGLHKPDSHDRSVGLQRLQRMIRVKLAQYTRMSLTR